MLPTRLQPHALIVRILLILILILGYTQSWSQCDDEDFDYLKDLYTSTNGDNWTNSTGWAFIRDNSDVPEDCDLNGVYGISLDAEGYVSEINLSNNNLTGTIPTEEYLPPSLTKINLSNNFIVGEIPNDFNDAPLIEIDYSNNQFSGSMPNDYDNLIEVINFSGNGLSGEIPDDLGDYTSLIILELGDNDNYGSAGIEGAIPLELGSLLNLTTLSLNDNNLSGCYATELKNLCGVATNATISAGNNLIGHGRLFVVRIREHAIVMKMISRY